MRIAGILLLVSVACGRTGAQTNGQATVAATNAHARATARVPAGVAVSFKDTLGRAYTNATVTRIEPGCLVLMTADGVVQLPAMVLPDDIKERFQIERLGAPSPSPVASTSAAPGRAPSASPAAGAPAAGARGAVESRHSTHRSGGGVGQGALRKGLVSERPATGGGAIRAQVSMATGGGAIRPQASMAAGGGSIAKPVISDEDAGLFDAVGRAQGMAQAGQFESAASVLAQMQDRVSPSAVDPAARDRFAETCMDVFERSRKQGEFAVARSSLQTAVGMHSDSARIMDRVLVLFEEADAAFDEGRFPDALRQVEITEGVGLDKNLLYLRKRKNLANAAISSGWSALFSLDFPRAATAVAAARKLWPDNPGLVWIDRIIATVSILAILAALVVTAKVFGKNKEKGAKPKRPIRSTGTKPSRG